MVNRNERYWKNKEERAAAAKNHLAYVSEKYKEEIREQVVNTVMYDARVMQRSDKSGNPRQFFLSADTVTAIFTAKRSKDTGKVAALNFASFKNPGGMFLAGSKAQEECLCMDSTLYPVLNSFRGTYYEPNKKLLNRSLYTDRALYTPDVVFENEECTVKADIITCAAPNKYAAQKYQKVSDEENEKVLINRLLFIRDIVADQGVDTLILGAFGCGVFGQDPQQVAELMDEIDKERAEKKQISIRAALISDVFPGWDTLLSKKENRIIVAKSQNYDNHGLLDNSDKTAVLLPEGSGNDWRWIAYANMEDLPEILEKYPQLVSAITVEASYQSGERAVMDGYTKICQKPDGKALYVENSNGKVSWAEETGYC